MKGELSSWRMSYATRDGELLPLKELCEINRFNKKPEELVEGEEASEIDITKIETSGLYFKPPLTRYIWKQGEKHSQSAQGALSEVFRKPIVRWLFDMECVQAIQSFTNHPELDYICLLLSFNSMCQSELC